MTYELVKYNDSFTSFAKLKDKRYLAFVSKTIGKWHEADYLTCQEIWIVVTNTKVEKDKFMEKDIEVLALEETKVIAKGIKELLERIIAKEGKYYFDDPNFIPDETLATWEKY